VQAILAAHKLAGERDHKHSHYLKGSLHCGNCGRRLTYSRNKGRGGTYEYFICSANQRHECPQRASTRRFWVSHEGEVERSQLKTPFDEIRVISEATRIVNDAAARRGAEPVGAGLEAENGKAPEPEEASGALALSSISTSMVELVGLEPTTSRLPAGRSPN
jgi:hypothetical protein